MRLPFMQLESDFLAHGAAELANLARCTVAQAIGHVSLLRAWAVSHATDEAPPDGWVPGEVGGRRIEAAAQWTGESGALLQALTDAGQVRQEEGGFRVLHLEAYVQAWNKNLTAKERMRTLRERSANKPRTTGERSAKFGQQTQMQKELQKPSASASPPGPAEAQGVLSLPVQAAARDVRPPKPRKPPPAQDLVSWVRDVTRPLRPEGAPDNCELTEAQWARLGELVRDYGLEPTKAGVRRWLGWAPAQEKGYPLGLFVAKAKGFVGEAMSSQTAGPQRASDGVGAGQAGECAGCGEHGEGYRADGNPGPWLGYRCGCGPAWMAELDAGRPYAEASAWAKERRGRAA